MDRDGAVSEEDFKTAVKERNQLLLECMGPVFPSRDACHVFLTTFTDRVGRYWQSTEPSIPKNNFLRGNTSFMYVSSNSPWNFVKHNARREKLTVHSESGEENVPNQTEENRLGPVNGSLSFLDCLNWIPHDSSNAENWLAVSYKQPLMDRDNSIS